LGISFHYISESEFHGMVGVEEKGDVIHLTLTGDPQGAGHDHGFPKRQNF